MLNRLPWIPMGMLSIFTTAISGIQKSRGVAGTAVSIAFAVTMLAGFLGFIALGPLSLHHSVEFWVSVAKSTKFNLPGVSWIPCGLLGVMLWPVSVFIGLSTWLCSCFM